MRHGYGRRDFNIGSVSDAPSVVYLPHKAAKETTLTEVAKMLTHVVAHMATKEDVADIKTEMMEQFERSISNSTHLMAAFETWQTKLR
jgi:hypothetical protein